MREQFEAWFVVNYPGMALDGPTASGEFVTWAAGYTAGMDRAVSILNGAPVKRFVDRVCDIVDKGGA